MAQRAEKIEHVALDGRRREAEVGVGEDETGRRQHAEILVRCFYLYNHAAGRPPEARATTSRPMRHVSTSEFRVRYSETDQMGVVYHTNYLVWCEIGRTDFIRGSGSTYADLERRGVLLAVSEASIRYHAPARYDDLIRVQTTLASVRSRAMTFDYLVTNGETGERLASARTVLVSLDRAGRPAAMPEDFRHHLAVIVASGEARTP